MKLPIGFLFIFAVMTYSCHTETSTNNLSIGTWRSIGSGLILDIKDSTNYSLYDFTAISCLANRKGN